MIAIHHRLAVVALNPLAIPFHDVAVRIREISLGFGCGGAIGLMGQASPARAPGEVPIKGFTAHLRDGTLGKLWTTGHQWKPFLAPTGSSALSQVPLRGCPEPAWKSFFESRVELDPVRPGLD
jgi:hypothetical protein